MTTYAFTTTVTGLDINNLEQLEALHTEDFILIPGQIDDVTMISVEVEAKTEREALDRVLQHITGLPGIKVTRIDEDLVNNPEIALRLDVTDQAARNYTSGRRGAAVAFPAPRTVLSGGLKLWTWSSVYAWALATGKIDADEPAPFSDALVDSYNGRLAERAMASRVWDSATQSVSMHVSKQAVSQQVTKRTDFAQAA